MEVSVSCWANQRGAAPRCPSELAENATLPFSSRVNATCPKKIPVHTFPQRDIALSDTDWSTRATGPQLTGQLGRYGPVPKGTPGTEDATPRLAAQSEC